jgi:hypothetical protein
MSHLTMHMYLRQKPLEACTNQMFPTQPISERRQWSELPSDRNSPTLPYIRIGKQVEWTKKSSLLVYVDDALLGDLPNMKQEC